MFFGPHGFRDNSYVIVRSKTSNEIILTWKLIFILEKLGAKFLRARLQKYFSCKKTHLQD